MEKDMDSSVFGVEAKDTGQPSVEMLIAKLEAATEGSRSLDGDIAETLGLQKHGAPRMRGIAGDAGFALSPAHAWIAPRYTTNTDTARTLLPESATNFHLSSFGGHGRKDIPWQQDCWAAQCHDRAQLIGDERAKRRVYRLRTSFQIDTAPFATLEKAIAEQYCDFGVTHAATPAIAVCILALKVRSHQTVDDDLWPDEETGPHTVAENPAPLPNTDESINNTGGTSDGGRDNG